MPDEPRLLTLHATRTLRVETESSIWMIEPDRYMRLPKLEAPRPSVPSLDAALDDAVWHGHRGVELVHDTYGLRLRIVPSSRYEGTVGIVTGVIVTTTPSLKRWTDETVERVADSCCHDDHSQADA